MPQINKPTTEPIIAATIVFGRAETPALTTQTSSGGAGYTKEDAIFAIPQLKIAPTKKETIVSHQVWLKFHVTTALFIAPQTIAAVIQSPANGITVSPGFSWDSSIFYIFNSLLSCPFPTYPRYRSKFKLLQIFINSPELEGPFDLPR